MSWIFGTLYVALLLYVLILVLRLVFDWVQVFAREWRPKGLTLLVAETAYTVTDPPLRFLRRVIPPLRIGQIQLDLAFLVLMLGCSFALQILAALT